MGKMLVLVNDKYVAAESLAGKVATYLFVTTSDNTSSGNWCVSEKEIERDLNLPAGSIRIIEDDIKDALYKYFGQFISYLDISEFEDELMFDISLYDMFICGFIEDDACYEK